MKVRMGKKRPAITANGPNDATASFGPLVSFFFSFLCFFCILTNVSRLYMYSKGSDGWKTAGDCGKSPKRRDCVVWATSMFFYFIFFVFFVI